MRTISAILVMLAVSSGSAFAQPLGTPDRGEPGDAMIQNYLERITNELHARFGADVASFENWKSKRPVYREEYLYMLGLLPLPERTPLKATITGTQIGEGFVVDNLHYQSQPGLYVTGNLYRPTVVKDGEKLPAVFYVCGHSGRGRDGNKTAYQTHGMWFARHGYICLVVDTLQLGEIAAIHHGTYRENRWWWHSRGYTSAGVECWNGVRGIDYLISRADVDPERIAVTGISGGGAATFWIAAADERVKVAVPISGMADLPSYVPNRVINGHCDCMFLYNTFEWPWTRIAGLVAPRPLLFVNSDNDRIFPMDANERVINQLERLYSLYGAGDRVDSVVSVGGHAYRKDIRQAVYWFINMHLKGDGREVTDGEYEVAESAEGMPVRPIDPKKLRVFPEESDIPKDQLNTTIDQSFVPVANVPIPDASGFENWRAALKKDLARLSFRSLPDLAKALPKVKEDSSVWTRIETEEGITVRVEKRDGPADAPKRILLFVQHETPDNATAIPDWLMKSRETGDLLYRCEPRGIGDTRWTRKNPPNYIARSHVLLGRTVDTGRVWDVIMTARFLRRQYDGTPIHLAGERAAGVLAVYAALWEPQIAGVIAHQPQLTHMDQAAPQFLNVLRVADIPDVFGMLAPRPVTVISGDDRLKKSVAIYASAGATDKLTIRKE